MASTIAEGAEFGDDGMCLNPEHGSGWRTGKHLMDGTTASDNAALIAAAAEIFRVPLTD
jgi:hypothetical protein